MELEKYLPFWENLSQNDQKYLLETSKTRFFEKNSIISRSDENCLGILVIEKGELSIAMTSEEGREITLFHLKSGEICVLSASCILSQITFDVFIEAISETKAIILNPAVFSEICSRNLYAENYILKNTIERFSDVMWSMQQILFMNFEKRLAIYLIDEEKVSHDGIIETTHEQIAKKVGSAREVVSRTLKKFADKGLVELSRGNIKILEKQTIRDIALK
ncbi:MAG: Crp/Fnr family transcriptional regulator [Oscillospiraceae bacterium]